MTTFKIKSSQQFKYYKDKFVLNSFNKEEFSKILELIIPIEELQQYSNFLYGKKIGHIMYSSYKHVFSYTTKNKITISIHGKLGNNQEIKIYDLMISSPTIKSKTPNKKTWRQKLWYNRLNEEKFIQKYKEILEFTVEDYRIFV